MSGALRERPQLNRCLQVLNEGDTLVIVRLDRLGRSLRHLVDILELLRERHIGLRSLTEGIDTDSPTGELIFHIFGAVSQFERSLIRERTIDGLNNARARGRNGGRPPKVTGKRLELARSLWDAHTHTLKQIAELLGCSESSVYRGLHRSLKPFIE